MLLLDGCRFDLKWNDMPNANQTSKVLKHQPAPEWLQQANVGLR